MARGETESRRGCCSPESPSFGGRATPEASRVGRGPRRAGPPPLPSPRPFWGRARGLWVGSENWPTLPPSGRAVAGEGRRIPGKVPVAAPLAQLSAGQSSAERGGPQWGARDPGLMRPGPALEELSPAGPCVNMTTASTGAVGAQRCFASGNQGPRRAPRVVQAHTTSLEQNL